MVISDDSGDEDNDNVLPSLFSASIPKRKIKKTRVRSMKYTLDDFSPISGLVARRGNQRMRLSTVIDNAFPDNKEAYAWQQYVDISNDIADDDPMLRGLERGEKDESIKLAFSRYV